MNWCFAVVNGKLAEIYFEKKRNDYHFLGHCYVKKKEYTTMRENRWIDIDTKRLKFSYRKGVYKNLINGKTHLSFNKTLS